MKMLSIMVDETETQKIDTLKEKLGVRTSAGVLRACLYKAYAEVGQ